MKKISLFLCIAAAFSVTFYSCNIGGPSTDNETMEETPSMTAVEYNDFIVNHQTAIISSMLDWLKFEKKDMVGELEEIVDLTRDALKEIKETKPYPGGEALRKAALDLFSYYERSLNGAFMEVAKIYQESNRMVSAEDAVKITQIIQEGTADEAKFDAAFSRAQQDFARANGMEIQENALQKDIDALNGM